MMSVKGRLEVMVIGHDKGILVDALERINELEYQIQSNTTEIAELVNAPLIEVPAHDDLTLWVAHFLEEHKAKSEMVVLLESQIAAKGKQEWIHMESEDSEPDDSLLNELGRRRFLCQVVSMGTMITATRLEIVQYAKGEGFLVKNKGGLMSGVTHWMPLPEAPSHD